MVTFDELCQLEPHLLDLAAAARRCCDDPALPSFCANQVWYGDGFRKRLDQLAGWHSRHPNPVVRSQGAYDVAYDAIYQMLPDCRGCQCW
jgi:hypothetical protein